ncbi:cell division ATP-binding protein FtsE [Patescibacteria group bacterium]|nr:cell division ATP-binding protein FtsE [Patescibacteria group bacterium]MBU4512984.1 cell division ATP-binding protein FtsE [Patescibacteria group bacterium]MCG2693021.1 cell division ATP-binding protein FtsE [Candidatus Parcubacteria bacterium]
MIKFRNISKVYPPDIYAVKDVSFHIKPKEMVSLVGRSGAGKSTLVKMLIAEEKPTKGRVIVGGWDITDIKQNEVPVLRRQIGVVFQDFKLLKKKTVFENIVFALHVCGAPPARIKTIVPKVLRIVGLEDKQQRFPEELSGGEQQRVVIARSLCHRPKILIADEPTGNLDSINTRDIINLLKKINEFGTTVVLVTHNREVVNYLKKRVITMDEGKIVSDRERGKYMI